MAKYRFKSELITGAFKAFTEAEPYTTSPEDTGPREVQAVSALSALPVLGMLIPALASIMQGGVLPLYQQDGARVYRPWRLPPEIILRLHRRGLLDETGLVNAFNDLADSGISDERIEAIRRDMEVLPTPQDVVSFLAHEVLEPEMIEKYGLDSEWEGVDKSLFAQIGMPEELAEKYWINHWQHASFSQVVELRRREKITDADVSDWFRLVEIPPFWRPLLMDLIWETPTRVDIRRFWDMQTITPERLRTLYIRHGYTGEDLEDYLLWTKVYVAFPDLIARCKNGWIKEQEVKDELVSLGMSRERAEELWQTKFKSVQPERVAKERDLTLAAIYKGVKKNKIERSFGLTLIQNMGYDEWEADVLMDTNVPVDTEDKVIAERELTKADILKGLKVKEIDTGQATALLVARRYTPADATLLVRIYTAVVEKPTEERKRQESKADIITAVKKGIIGPQEGYLRLLDIDFTPEASEFILTVRAEESPFSPQTPSEFLNTVNKYRRSIGLSIHETTEMAIEAEKVYLEAEAKLADARQRAAPQADILQLEALRDELKARFETALASSQEA